jgi:ERCC4-type nuclease
LPYGALFGAYANASLLEGVAVLRTVNIEETKYLIVSLAKKCQTMSKHPSRGLASKRKKDGDVETIWIRQLTCVPTISESIAVALLKHFGTLSGLREALRGPASFPVVPLSRSASLGKARIAKLAEVLLQ